MRRYAWLTSPPYTRQEIPVTFSPPEGTSWSGIFECAERGRIEVIPWQEANSLVILATNALYIVDCANPENFCGFGAELEIRNAVFDEGRERLFIADNRRVRAYSREKKLLWLSPALDGYDATLIRCLHGILTIELKQNLQLPEDVDVPRETIQLRAEDGTLYHSNRPGRTTHSNLVRRHSA